MAAVAGAVRRGGHIMENYLTNLKKSDMFELIINQIGGVSLVGKDGRYVYVNQPFSEITGYSLEELKGRYVRDFFPDNLMDKVLVTGKSLVSVPYRIQNKNMETVQLISSYYPISVSYTHLDVYKRQGWNSSRPYL